MVKFRVLAKFIIAGKSASKYSLRVATACPHLPMISYFSLSECPQKRQGQQTNASGSGSPQNGPRLMTNGSSSITRSSNRTKMLNGLTARLQHRISEISPMHQQIGWREMDWKTGIPHSVRSHS